MCESTASTHTHTSTKYQVRVQVLYMNKRDNMAIIIPKFIYFSVNVKTTVCLQYYLHTNGL
jgi:hypothetical protein